MAKATTAKKTAANGTKTARTKTARTKTARTKTARTKTARTKTARTKTARTKTAGTRASTRADAEADVVTASRGAPGPSHWLVKSEPDVYSFADLERDGHTRWDGVRSHEARNNLGAMKAGDLLLYYHSNEGKAVVGLARVAKAAYPEPGAEENGERPWLAVDVEPVMPLVEPVTLAQMKAGAATKEMAVVRKSRLSVSPVTAAEFRAVLKAGKTTLQG